MHEFLGRNTQGATVRLGLPGVEGAFTPGELLQVALAEPMSLTTEDFIMRRARQNVASGDLVR